MFQQSSGLYLSKWTATCLCMYSSLGSFTLFLYQIIQEVTSQAGARLTVHSVGGWRQVFSPRSRLLKISASTCLRISNRVTVTSHDLHAGWGVCDNAEYPLIQNWSSCPPNHQKKKKEITSPAVTSLSRTCLLALPGLIWNEWGTGLFVLLPAASVSAQSLRRRQVCLYCL